MLHKKVNLNSRKRLAESYECFLCCQVKIRKKNLHNFASKSRTSLYIICELKFAMKRLEKRNFCKHRIDSTLFGLLKSLHHCMFSLFLMPGEPSTFSHQLI